MSLSDFQPVTAKVGFKGGEFEVRGITLDDLAVLMRNHLDDLEALVEIFARDDVLSPDNVVSVLTKHAVGLVREAPGLVANLIALAADEPENVDQARKLSMPTMVKAVETIAELTFEEAGGAKKFVESLQKLLMGLRPPRQ